MGGNVHLSKLIILARCARRTHLRIMSLTAPPRGLRRQASPVLCLAALCPAGAGNRSAAVGEIDAARKALIAE